MVRDLLVTTPDRLKAAWRALLARIEAARLRLIDRYLARREEERAPRLLTFDELPVLYDEADFPIVTDEIPGWRGNSTPEALDYRDSEMV